LDLSEIFPIPLPDTTCSMTLCTSNDFLIIPYFWGAGYYGSQNILHTTRPFLCVTTTIWVTTPQDGHKPGQFSGDTRRLIGLYYQRFGAICLISLISLVCFSVSRRLHELLEWLVQLTSDLGQMSLPGVNAIPRWYHPCIKTF
jgi:hypothetical protein